MTQELLSGLNGYDIPCRHTIQGGESMVCLITHGFGSSKDSPPAQLLAGELPRHGIGTLALDLPAHGDSPVDGDALSIRHCLDDLARAEARALELAPGARVVYFSSSFGAYLNLIYLSTRPHRGTRSFLRSAAVEMPLLFHSPTPEQAEELARQGFLMLDQGYVRPLKPALCPDLRRPSHPSARRGPQPVRPRHAPAGGPGGPGVLPGPLSPQHSSMPSTWTSSARRVSSSVTCLTPKYNFFIYYREKTIILQLFLPVLS